MKYSFDYKDEESKLVRFDVEITKGRQDEGIVKDISITGDFFATPERIISSFESFLKGMPVCCDLNRLEEDLKSLVSKSNVTLIGIRPDIIVKAFAYFCEKFKKDSNNSLL